MYVTFKTQNYSVSDLSQKFLIGFINLRSMLELQSFMQYVCFLAKLLVSTGSPVDNGVVSEVLDLQNATNICSPMSDFPIKTSQVESIRYSNFKSGHQIKK